MADILDAAQSTTQTPPEPTPPVPEPPMESDSLIIPPAEQPATPSTPTPPQNIPEKPKKKSHVGILVAGLLLLIITIPILTVYMKQQNDIRSRAAGTGPWNEGVYATSTPTPTTTSTPPPTITCIFDDWNTALTCINVNGQWQWCNPPKGEMGWLVDHDCTTDKCDDNNNPYYCIHSGTNYACIKSGTCTPTNVQPKNCHTGSGCGSTGNTSTPTATTTVAPQCTAIVAYDTSGNALSQSDLNALKPGATITLAFAPGGAATKVRFNVNSGAWNETTTKNANGQFTWNYTLNNTTSFTITVQWFDGTNWNN